MNTNEPFTIVFDPLSFQKLLEQSVQTALEKALPEYLALKSKQEEIKLLSKKDVCKIFSVSLKAVNDWMSLGILTTIKINSRVFFSQDDIEQLIKDNTFRSGGK